MSIGFNILGTRGSIPNSDWSCREFGGATSCYYMDLGERHVILDAGSGIVPLGNQLVKNASKTPIDIFFTHFHYDHIIGLPFFAPLFKKDWPVRLWSSDLFGKDALDCALDKLFSAPLCPITRDLLRADIELNTIDAFGRMSLRSDVTISTVPLSHPGGNAAYRIDHGQNALVYSGDFEHGDATSDDNLVKLMDQATYAFLDMTYTPDSYTEYKGYGHAHWKAACELAHAAGVQRCIGLHHENLVDDATLKANEAKMQSAFPNSAFARQGQTFTI